MEKIDGSICIRFSVVLISALTLGCGEIGNPKGPGTELEERSTPPPEPDQPLVWESASKPERSTWSSELVRIVGNHFTELDQAQDIKRFCPPYDRLSRNKRIRAWANLIASVTYFESGWNPLSHSVDVGHPDNRDTWSVGLLQMSVVDQKNYKLTFGYSFADLQRPVPNLELGMAILARQISRYGVIAIPKGGRGLYWAVLHPGGKYDRTERIAEMAMRLKICSSAP